MNRDIIKECVDYVVLNKEKKDEIIRIFQFFKDLVPESDLDYYDRVSPILLKELDRRDDKEEIFNKLYDSTIKVSTKAITSGKYNVAYYFIKAHILDLQEKILTKEHNDKLIKTLKPSRF